MNDRRFTEYFYNPITYLGVGIAVVTFFIELLLFAFDFFSGGNIYLELITYLILPGALFFGLFLIPIGYLVYKRRIARSRRLIDWQHFRIDLSQAKHRNALMVFIIGTSLLVLMSTVGSYQAFQYTESVEFCGTLCHSVMKPEYTAYQNSPHGRVKCVECHIGSGADWYVRSKASGLRQVFRTALNTYDRPIKTPIHNLRPAEETCKECHWPGKFFSTLDFRRAYFLKEEENPRWNMRMLLNVGSGQNQVVGIHAHMNLDSEMYYAAEDPRRLKITWVKTIGKDGKETVFTTEDSKFKNEPPSGEEVRHMDCIDCHNRPTHQYQPPFRLMNSALLSGEVSPAIPNIKEQGVEVLAKKYKTLDEAREGIRAALTKYYSDEQSDFYQGNKASVENAVVKITSMYENNFFPEMKTRWDAYPDHIGHLFSPGCFRCHDGEHKSASGKAISHDCNACHLIVEQGPPGKEAKNLDGLPFEHPDGSDDWKDSLCTDCHTGGAD